MEALIKLIEKLPVTFIEGFIVVLALFLIWLVPHLRFDSNKKGLQLFGKHVYFYRKRFAEEKANRKLNKINDAIGDMRVDIGNLNKKVDHNTLDTCKIIIFSGEYPIIERLWSAKRYLDSGGNAETKRFIEENLIPENQVAWEAINREKR
jgi:hypothetical protein